MPFKKKAVANSDTSDSGPDDKEPAPKRPKTDKKKNDDEEPSWALDKKRFLKVREFKGKLMVDIREYYDSNGDLKPGKKGISLSVQQWKKLVEVVPEVEDALKESA